MITFLRFWNEDPSKPCNYPMDWSAIPMMSQYEFIEIMDWQNTDDPGLDEVAKRKRHSWNFRSPNKAA